MYSELQGATFVLQEPGCKDVGLMHSGTKLVKGHARSHEQEAYGHGVFWLIKNKHRSAASYLTHKDWTT